jgi:hypothetical protein
MLLLSAVVAVDQYATEKTLSSLAKNLFLSKGIGPEFLYKGLPISFK